jgi:hypothetical protein
MGIDAEITPRDRDHPAIVSDSRGVFARFLASSPLPESVCLRFIDPYGQTVFNLLQLPVLLEELERVQRNTSATDLREHLKLLTSLVRKAQARGPHSFVTFAGE